MASLYRRRTDQDRRSANMARRRKEKTSHASDVVNRSHLGGMRAWESLAALAQVAVTELARVSYAVGPSGKQTRADGRTDVESKRLSTLEAAGGAGR